MIYYDIIVWVVKNSQSVAYDNYDDFQHVNFIFSQKFGSLFSNDMHVNCVICSNASEWFKSLWPRFFYVKEGSAVSGFEALTNWEGGQQCLPIY
jgi:hypothetical protein